MAEPQDIPAWILLFLGILSLAGAMAELRARGTWLRMLAEFERGPALRFLLGFFEFSLGAAIYLVTPWRPDDWVAVAASALGGVMVAEGALILAMGDRVMAFARRLVGRAGGAWAGFTALVGFALIAAAMSRLQ